MASIFDLMGKFGEISDAIEKNKGLFEQMPNVLNQWTGFFQATYQNTLETKVAAERIEVLCRAILNAVDPHQIPEEMARDVIANSVNDPRNQPAQTASDVMVENAARLKSATEGGPFRSNNGG